MIKEIAPGIEKRLCALDRSEEVLDWVMQHPEETERIILFYDSLVKKLNEIPYGHSILKVMPAAQNIKETLEESVVPMSKDYKHFNGARLIHAGLMEAVDPMLVGQKIKNREIVNPTKGDKDYAIGTTSMDTSNDALVFGTIGHMLERTFFNWARENGYEPDEGWQKDMFLFALDEMVLMHLATQQVYVRGDNNYIDYFMQSNDMGGLGWLNKERCKIFKRKFWNVLVPNMPRK